MSDITVTIKSSGDKKYEVTFDPKITILELKELIAEKSSIAASSQRLIYSGKVLKDDQTVESYKVQNSHTIHMVRSSNATSANSGATATGAGAGAASSLGAASGAGATTTTNLQHQPASNIPSNIAAGQGSFNPLADLTGARYAGYAQLPSASLFGPDGGMNANALNPDELNSVMSNPAFQEQMNAMLSNPQMLDFMIQQNPQLRAMGPQARQMLQSPLFRQMLTNPELMRSALQMGQLGGGSGGNLFGGAAGGLGSSFPAPGANPTTEGAASETSEGSADNRQVGTNANSGGAAAANPFAGLFPSGVPPFDPVALFGGNAAGGNIFGQPAAPQDNRPPEERYESQLHQLNDMGFFDFDRNIEALRRTGGSVQGAIEYLLNGN
ncbi:hypothetical protein KGF56_002836 [Candida oxycetoniae]|uniref:Ubiquitin domain-containing protein DSK2 n=1 Tax=Candida oxycetoniae TaxID=497107 RepID=A0AAI9SWC2_9ASCO|nr:uncharacterized protein KGF56_002836 [Candida oxycetoniae]KAI3404316.2 hypothetical protein KGF56_002836 [Candida oxycetoniae]